MITFTMMYTIVMKMSFTSKMNVFVEPNFVIENAIAIQMGMK